VTYDSDDDTYDPDAVDDHGEAKDSIDDDDDDDDEGGKVVTKRGAKGKSKARAKSKSKAKTKSKSKSKSKGAKKSNTNATHKTGGIRIKWILRPMHSRYATPIIPPGYTRLDNMGTLSLSLTLPSSNKIAHLGEYHIDIMCYHKEMFPFQSHDSQIASDLNDRQWDLLFSIPLTIEEFRRPVAFGFDFLSSSSAPAQF
jgi:hypothetical protein